MLTMRAQTGMTLLLAALMLLALLNPNNAQAKNAAITTALVYDSGALDTDHAFIRMARRGAEKAQEELGQRYDEFRLPEKEPPAAFMRSIAKKGYSLIIAVGYQNVIAVLSLAEEFPQTKFTVIDGLVPPIYPNVQSIVFKDHEGAFLIGMIAAYSSKSDKIGFIGGMDIPLIRNFESGFRQGASFVRPGITIASDMIGTTSDAWSRPDLAYDLAAAQFEKGHDIIFAAAGGSSIGVLRAAKDMKKQAIGVDTNQNGTFPGFVLTSLVKRVDLAVFKTIRRALDGTWQPGIKSLGLRESALDFAVDRHNRNLLSSQVVDQVLAVRERIVNGLIEVKTYSPQ